MKLDPNCIHLPVAWLYYSNIKEKDKVFDVREECFPEIGLSFQEKKLMSWRSV